MNVICEASSWLTMFGHPCWGPQLWIRIVELDVHAVVRKKSQTQFLVVDAKRIVQNANKIAARTASVENMKI